MRDEASRLAMLQLWRSESHPRTRAGREPNPRPEERRAMRFYEFGRRVHELEIGTGTDAAGGGLGTSSLIHGRGVAESLAELGLEIVREGRGPMRLWDFAARLRHRLGMPPLPAGELCDAVKSALAVIEHPRLRILAPSMPGVGYVYDEQDPDSHPVRSSR